MITDAWETINSLKNKLGPTRKFEIYEKDYWANTREIQVDYSIEGRRKRREINDKQIVSEAIKVFKIEKSPTVMYTDGARSVNSISTGSSVIIKDQDTAYYSSSPKECSSFTAETIAIKAAIGIIGTHMIEYKENIIIFSDCKSVLSAINSNLINVYHNRYITEIKGKIYEIRKSGIKIRFVWIPAHIGIPGNEVADQIAKESANEFQSSKIFVPFTDLRTYF